uniref:Uncharacterized protein n=1 Tax=Grammatophora oceanica TaxID=210454 RepID=A0A7S1UYQ8_9STRA|mmetsp:Transcript_29798/g.43947  ORF Transcript_29798/g.43947 Transcript_29798/m.43947 type:complete len:189 (+) Transcript_29798:171-737(+)
MINLLLCTPIGDSACFGMFGPDYYGMDEEDSRSQYKRGAPKYHHPASRSSGNDHHHHHPRHHHHHHHGNRKAWIRKIRSVPHSSAPTATYPTTMIEKASPLSPPSLHQAAGMWRDHHHAAYHTTSLLDSAPVDHTLMSRLSGILEASNGPLQQHYHELDWDDLVTEDTEFGYRLTKTYSSSSTDSSSA